MKVSVIVPTRDRSGLLDACLQSLTAQSLPSDDFEVVVVDNGSTDSTKQIAFGYMDRLQLRYVVCPEPGLHAGRHAGLRLSQSGILAFCDDDIFAGPGWLSAVVQAFSDTSAVLVGGNNLPMFEARPPAWLDRWWNMPVGRGRALPQLSILDFGQGRFEVDPRFIWGCNFCIRRDALLAAGGFHPDALPPSRLRWRGDGETHVSEWLRSKKLRGLFDSRASVHHRVPVSRMTPAYFKARSHAQGVSDSYTDIRLAGRNKSPFPTLQRRRFRVKMHRLRLACRTPADTVAKELREMQLAALDAWQEGYDFHQREVRNDPALFSWVIKESYL